MLRTIALKNREPKVEENPKQAIFIRGSSTNQIVNNALSDLCSIKKPYSIIFSKKNTIHPFDDQSSLEFFSQKNDASLFGTNSKKRPNNLVFIRMFDYQVLDMIELGIENFKSLHDFKTAKSSIEMKPLFIFNGELFEQREEYKKLKNMLLDFFRDEAVESVNLKGLEYIISVTAEPIANPTYFEEMGPSFDFVFRRNRFAGEDIMKEATKIPKELKAKNVKNVSHNDIGDKMGRILMKKQNFDTLQTKKIKALKKSLKKIMMIE
ncbi:Brix-domain-containing protein [Neocallimastix sp. 'constans']